MCRINEEGGDCVNACRFTVHLRTSRKVSKMCPRKSHFGDGKHIQRHFARPLDKSKWDSFSGDLGGFTFCYKLEIQEGREGAVHC